MKKLLFIDSYSFGLNGAPKSMISLADGISKKEYADVTVASSIYDGVLAKSHDLGLKTLSLRVPLFLLKSRKKINSITAKAFYFFLLIYYWFFQLYSIDFKKYDKICVNDVRAFLFFLPSLILNRNKIVWYVRINDKVKYINTIALMLSYRVILISSDCINMFSEEERFQYSAKFKILHTGFLFDDIDDEIVAKIRNEVSSGRIYISIGTICDRKNQISIVKAFDRLQLSDAKLLLIGDCTAENYYYKDMLTEVILTCKSPQNIILLPYTKYVNEYLSISDVFLFASYKEGLPRVVIEAAYAGCVIYSSNVDGIKDIITDSRLGEFSQLKATSENFNDDFYEIIKNLKVEEVYKHKKFRREYISENFSYDSFIDGFYKIAIK